MEKQKIKAVIEAILFTMGNSVEIDELAAALEAEPENACQLCTKTEYYEYLIRIARQPKKYVLTDVVLETLSIVAYKQPVTRLEIEKIRGVKCDHAVNKLVEYGLIEEAGRLDAPGRPILFATTEDFLRTFGVSSATDLPRMSPEQMEDFKEEAEEEIEQRMKKA